MAILDIRKESEKITSIQFDDSSDRVKSYSKVEFIIVGICGEFLCEYDNADNLIAAIKKAKELWGNSCDYKQD